MCNERRSQNVPENYSTIMRYYFFHIKIANKIFKTLSVDLKIWLPWSPHLIFILFSTSASYLITKMLQLTFSSKMGPRHSLVGLTKNAVKTTNNVTIISCVTVNEETNDIVTPQQCNNGIITLSSESSRCLGSAFLSYSTSSCE